MDNCSHFYISLLDKKIKCHLYSERKLIKKKLGIVEVALVYNRRTLDGFRIYLKSRAIKEFYIKGYNSDELRAYDFSDGNVSFLVGRGRIVEIDNTLAEHIQLEDFLAPEKDTKN